MVSLRMGLAAPSVCAGLSDVSLEETSCATRTIWYSVKKRQTVSGSYEERKCGIVVL